MISKSNTFKDFNSCFVAFHPMISIGYYSVAPSTTLFITQLEECNTALLSGIIPLFQKEKLGQFQPSEMHSL